MSESFQRDQETEEGFTVEVTFATEPPLRRQVRKQYRLRATEEPDTFTFDMSTPNDAVESALREAERRASPKIRFEETDIE